MNDETVAMIIVLPTIVVVLGILAFWELAAVREP